MAAELPRISIVTPSYNQAAFIERAMRSVLDQGYPNLEYLVVDGGSTDGTVDIIRKYEDRLAWWVSEKDRGQTHALNKGFQRATGDVVAWLNSDDMYLPGAFRAVGEPFARDPSLDVVFGDSVHIDKDDRVLNAYKNVPYWWPSMILLGVVLPQPTAFWKRSLFERHGWLDESKRFAMDYEFFCRIGAHIKARHVRREVVAFRLHADQKTETLRSVCVEETDAIRRQYAKSACGRWPPRLLWVACMAHRAFWHLVRGEWAYVWRGFVRRSRASARPRTGAEG